MHNKKGILFLALFSFLGILFVMPGCAPSTGATSRQTLVIWHWMTDRSPAFEELARRYEKETGIPVQFELYAPSDAYSQKIRAAAQGATLPDIFGILGEKRDFASFIKAGHILNLSASMSENDRSWQSSFFEKALAVNEFPEGNSYGVEAGIYGVPLDVMNIQMVYNKDLLKKAGGDPENPPQTFDEFIALGKKIKDARMQGVVSGWGELWMVDCFASNYAFNIMGKDKVLATIRGEVPYTDPDWVKVLSLFVRLRDSGILADGIVTMVNKTAEQLFANERAVFAFNGSWCVNVYKGMNPNLSYGAMIPPRVSTDNPLLIWGGAGSSFMVNAKSPKAQEAVKFLRWLTAKEQQTYLSEATNNLPSNKESLSTIPVILSDFANAMEQTTHPNVWGVSEFSPVIEAFDKGIHSIIIGEKSPEEVASDVQRIKVREMAKRAK